MAVLDLATWATILGTWVLVVGTLAFAYWQLRQAQRLHSATTLLDLRQHYFSPRLVLARRQLSSWLLATPPGEEPQSWEVGFFFEQVGFLTHSRVLETRMVWNAFGTWITAYYVLMTQPVDRLADWRKETDDPAIFAEFEWLAREMLELDRRSSPNRSRPEAVLADAREVLESESRLSAMNEPPVDLARPPP